MNLWAGWSAPCLKKLDSFGRWWSQALTGARQVLIAESLEPERFMTPQLDGFDDRSPALRERHVQATYAPRNCMEVYAAVKNVLGFVQQNAIIAPGDPLGPDFDPGRVYGPLQGRRLLLGTRWAVGR